jgi:predicted phage terminase large subunit-like protein
MSTLKPQKISLHPKQQEFIQSAALYRAFCGGVGSGKSWAGSYDMIRRGKAGRLYMCVSPTYTMLQDSTFREFRRVAEGLDVLQDLKESAPPVVKLRTGCEIIFRSADDAERLRGPNLSGVWLDEASMMSEDVFNVAIGRLREEGEQGWLSATFTPKGRRHWTYEVFGTGRPDTALFRSATSENPFLPARFTDTIAKQYTSQLASQELLGEFIEAGGCLFRRHWFGIVERAPQNLELAYRGWDLASSDPEVRKGGYDPDYTAGVLIGRTVEQTYYILNVRRIRETPGQVQLFVRQTAEEDGRHRPIVMEEESGAAGKAIIEHYRRFVLPGFIFYGVRSTGSKTDRALPLAAMAEGGAVKLVRGHWNKDWLDEVESFPFSRHDDQIDAASLAFNKLAKQPHVISQPPTILTPPQGALYGPGEMLPQGNHGRGPGATGIGGEYGPLARGEFLAPGLLDDAWQWPRGWTVKQD